MVYRIEFLESADLGKKEFQGIVQNRISILHYVPEFPKAPTIQW